MWINDNNNGFVFTWNGHELNPLLSTTMLNTQHELIRRGLTSRNNLLFKFNVNTFNVESYDITDPTTPVLVNGVAFPGPFDPLHGFGTVSSFAFDAASNKLFVSIYFGGTGSNIYSMTVASNGTLGAMNLVAQVDPSQGFTIGELVIYNNLIWVQARFGTYAPYKLDGSGAGAGSFNLIGTPYDWFGIRPRLKGKYLFIGCGTANAGHEAIAIYDISTGTLLYQLGGNNNTCKSLMVSGNTLIYAIGSNLFTYDITALLASGGAPVQLGTVGGAAVFNGLTGYFADGWEGNNGGCAT